MPESGGAPPPSLNSALAAFLIAAEGIAALRSTPLKDRFLPSSAPSDSAKRKDCSSLCCCAARAAAHFALAVLARSLAAVSTLLGLAARESLGAQPLVADAASDLNGATDAARKLYGGGMLSDQIGSDQTGDCRSGPGIRSDRFRSD